MHMVRSLVLLLVALPLPAAWSPESAAQYLDARQKLWVVWPRALASGVPCISCHTGLPYLISRAALRQSGAPASTYETTLLDGVRAKAADPKVAGAHSVLDAMVLALDESRNNHLSPAAEQVFERMWAQQFRKGSDAGAWAWFKLNQDPWEADDSVYYGAALAALATGMAPGDYQSRANIREGIGLMKTYLCDHMAAQPLHNRLAVLWASRKLRDLLPDREQRAVLDELRRKQSADGGWTIDSLGAFPAHEKAPPAVGSNGYATAIAAFTMVKAGVPASDKALARALDWLRAHQNAQAGYWDAQSMNRVYEAGSMPLEFMRDAATGYALAALTEAR